MTDEELDEIEKALAGSTIADQLKLVTKSWEWLRALVAEVRRLRAEIKRAAGLFVAEYGPVGEQKITLVGDSYHVEMPAPIRIRALHQEEACEMAVTKEREACAVIAEQHDKGVGSDADYAVNAIAAAIRARGDK